MFFLQKQKEHNGQFSVTFCGVPQAPKSPKDVLTLLFRTSEKVTLKRLLYAFREKKHSFQTFREPKSPQAVP